MITEVLLGYLCPGHLEGIVLQDQSLYKFQQYLDGVGAGVVQPKVRLWDWVLASQVSQVISSHWSHAMTEPVPLHACAQGRFILTCGEG